MRIDLPAAFAVLLAVCPLAVQAETIRVAHDQRFPPFAEVKDGKSEGLAVDILNAAAERSGLTIVYVALAFTEIQKTLEDGRADAVFPLAINPERRQVFDFSAPLVITGGALFVRAPQPTPDGLKALSGKTVVTPKTGPLAGFIGKTAPEVKLVVNADYDQSFAQLLSGEADAAALNFQVGRKLASTLHAGKVTLPEKLFLELPLAVAVSKGQSADLIARLDRGIAAIRADGTWQRIDQRWAGN
jgi:polar amino acid transport system substrate-binding protein